VAVIPAQTSRHKIVQIERYGGRCHLVRSGDTSDEARRLAHELGGHYMDQFTYAERATDWRGNNNIAESMFKQMDLEEHGIPSWVVVGAGTGGTSATIGRYVRYQRYATRLCVCDPENSVFFDHFCDRSPASPMAASHVEGVGRPRVEASFQREVIDRMIRVPDAASFAALRFLENVLHRRCGGSTGTNVYASCQILSEMRARGESGSVVTLVCDPGERYADTYYDDDWLRARGFDIAPHLARLQAFGETGDWPPLPPDARDSESAERGSP
jgi:cysteine synthase A